MAKKVTMPIQEQIHLFLAYGNALVTRDQLLKRIKQAKIVFTLAIQAELRALKLKDFSGEPKSVDRWIQRLRNDLEKHGVEVERLRARRKTSGQAKKVTQVKEDVTDFGVKSKKLNTALSVVSEALLSIPSDETAKHYRALAAIAEFLRNHE